MVLVNRSEIDYKAAKGWVKDGEADLLFFLASQLGPNAVALNIGIEFGKSLACLRAGNPDMTIEAFDLDCSKVEGGGYGALLHTQDSHEAARVWNQPLDLIFIDGDHGEAGVLEDARFADWLKLGHYVLFQDSWSWEETGRVHEMCPGVNQAVDKWFSTHSNRFEELPSVDTTRVFRRVKEDGQLPYRSRSNSEF